MIPGWIRIGPHGLGKGGKLSCANESLLTGIPEGGPFIFAVVALFNFAAMAPFIFLLLIENFLFFVGNFFFRFFFCECGITNIFTFPFGSFQVGFYVCQDFFTTIVI